MLPPTVIAPLVAHRRRGIDPESKIVAPTLFGKTAVCGERCAGCHQNAAGDIGARVRDQARDRVGACIDQQARAGRGIGERAGGDDVPPIVNVALW